MDIGFMTPAPGHGSDQGRQPTGGPQFCPRCGRGAPGGVSVCRDCGETLELQGYCPVCEAHWPLPSGSTCPKHDLLLAPGGPTAEGGRTTALHEEWVTVGSF